MRTPLRGVLLRLHDYGGALGDVAFWAPYVREVLRRHRHDDGDQLVGIIDWGDAFVTDPYYELAGPLR